MWAIQIIDGGRRNLYLREHVLDGRILVFEKEETALRFMRTVNAKLMNAFKVSIITARYENPIKGESPVTVSNIQAEQSAQIINDFLN